MKKPINQKIIDLISEFNYISIYDLSEIMETFHAHDWLSKKGKEFVHEFWGEFIKNGEDE